MTKTQFFNDYVRSAIDALQRRTQEVDPLLPRHASFLQGSRCSLRPPTASFCGVAMATTREMMLLALLGGGILYLAENLRDVAALVSIGNKAAVSGGGPGIRGFLACPMPDGC